MKLYASTMAWSSAGVSAFAPSTTAEASASLMALRLPALTPVMPAVMKVARTGAGAVARAKPLRWVCAKSEIACSADSAGATTGPICSPELPAPEASATLAAPAEAAPTAPMAAKIGLTARAPNATPLATGTSAEPKTAARLCCESSNEERLFPASPPSTKYS